MKRQQCSQRQDSEIQNTVQSRNFSDPKPREMKSENNWSYVISVTQSDMSVRPVTKSVIETAVKA